ncbi:MAG: hypothetical protein A07HR60_01149 [uncultured archaeon A07HR60]|nr:MAG: hypothetical protein A07HR60_01149 [uncultured archaeon A07HR60]
MSIAQRSCDLENMTTLSPKQAEVAAMHGAGYTCEAIVSVASDGCRPSLWERTDS